MTPKNISEFQIKESFWNDRLAKWKYSIFKRITRKSLPLFFRGQDIISITPQTDGSYDKGTIEFFRFLAECGHNGFLFDIGANIGLISAQAGRFFKELHMFEPNPYACHILRVNSFLALKNINYTIHEFGLGARDEILNLHIPYDNWGGAFVTPPENEYDEKLLSEKDGYGEFNIENYQLVPVTIQSAHNVLSNIFNDLTKKESKYGIIKIDVEGMDAFIIEQILDLLPSDFSVYIIFENRNTELDTHTFRLKHPRVKTLYQLQSKRTKWIGAPRWLNSLINWWKDDGVTILREVEGKLGIGDFIIDVPIHRTETP